jgi:glycosyltransferase involved in cell wall biosynthesis
MTGRLLTSLGDAFRPWLRRSRRRPLAAGEKPRILYFIAKYPQFSETYMHEEIAAVADDFDLKIVTYNATKFPRAQSFPYEVVEYADPCLVYAPFHKIDVAFRSPTQREFLRRIDGIIDDFQPTVLHAHYFGLALLLRNLARRHRLPYTLRTHSMDMLSEPEEKLQALCDAVRDSWCQRVLTFPPFRGTLTGRGVPSEKVVGCWPVVNFARFHRPERRAPTGGVLCAGPATPKKGHTTFIDLAALMRDSGLRFDLYARGVSLGATTRYNAEHGDPVTITYADPDEMADVYPRYDWLIYPGNPRINKIGFPVGIAEAQASGLGVCWQELPGRREEQLEFLAGGGFVFRTVEELPAILGRPYPEEMRQRGFENARRCDIQGHKGLLTEVWHRIAAAQAA